MMKHNDHKIRKENKGLPSNARKQKRILWWSKKQTADISSANSKFNAIQKIKKDIANTNKHGFRLKSMEKEAILDVGDGKIPDKAKNSFTHAHLDKEFQKLGKNKGKKLQSGATEKKDMKKKKKRSLIQEDDDDDKNNNTSEKKSKMSTLKDQSLGKRKRLKSNSKSPAKKKLKKGYLVLFLGNLSFDTSEEDIKKHFENSGNIDSVRLLTDKLSGKSKGCAFLELKDEETYTNALKLNHSSLKNREINVGFSNPGKTNSRKKKYIQKKNVLLYKE